MEHPTINRGYRACNAPGRTILNPNAVNPNPTDQPKGFTPETTVFAMERVGNPCHRLPSHY